MIYGNFNNVPVTKYGARTAVHKLIHRWMVQRRGWVGWVKCGCPPHQHLFFTRCYIRRSTHPHICLLPSSADPHIRRSAFYHCPIAPL